MLSLAGIILPLTPLRSPINHKRSHAHPLVTNKVHYMIIFQRQMLLIIGTEETIITFYLNDFVTTSSVI